MFALNEEELQGLSNEMQSLQLQLKRIEEFTTKVRSRSKTTKPIKTSDRSTFEKNLELILAIQSTPSFKETVIQYFLNNLFESNIDLGRIIAARQRADIDLYSKQERQIRLSTALLTDIVIQKVPEFPYSVAGLIISFVQIDHAIEHCKSALKVDSEVAALYSKTRQSRDFSDDLFAMFSRVDRRLFVPEHEKEECNLYDRPISLNYGISLSAPHIHVHALKQFEHLLTTHHDGLDAVKFMDVGGGTGYVATLMAVGFVQHNTNESWFKSFGCIYNPILLEQAKAARHALNLTPFLEYRQATVEMANIGWPEKGPFDGIYCGAAIKEEDAVLLREQLKVGGYLMCVVEHPDSIHNQKMKLVKRVGRHKGARSSSKRTVWMGSESLSSSSTRWRGDSLSASRSRTERGLSSEDEDDSKGDCLLETTPGDGGWGGRGHRESEDEDEEADEEDDVSVDLSHDGDFEETELFDVRFRSLRTRFQYLIDDEPTDSDEESE